MYSICIYIIYIYVCHNNKDCGLFIGCRESLDLHNSSHPFLTNQNQRCRPLGRRTFKAMNGSHDSHSPSLDAVAT